MGLWLCFTPFSVRFRNTGRMPDHSQSVQHGRMAVELDLDEDDDEDFDELDFELLDDLLDELWLDKDEGDDRDESEERLDKELELDFEELDLLEELDLDELEEDLLELDDHSRQSIRLPVVSFTGVPPQATVPEIPLPLSAMKVIWPAFSLLAWATRSPTMALVFQTYTFCTLPASLKLAHSLHPVEFFVVTPSMCQE